MTHKHIVLLAVLGLVAGSSLAIAQQPLDASWLREYNAPPPYDVVKDLAVDNRGGVVVTGSMTVKYSGSGDTSAASRGWVKPGGDAVAVDHEGNALVVATVVNAGTSKDFLIRKYSSNGTFLWERSYNGSANGTDSAVALVVGAAGNSIVVGTSTFATTGKDCVTIRYTPSGDTTQMSGGWVRRFADPIAGSSGQFAYGVALGKDGSIYTLGSSWSTGFSGGNAHFVIKYTPTGDTATGAGGWVARNIGQGYTFGEPVEICVDSQGYVGVTGFTPHSRCCTGDFANSDYFTCRIDPSGNQLWDVIYGGYGYDSEPGDIEADTQGYFYVTGKSRASLDTNSDYVTVKYDQGGSPLWQSPFNGARNSSHGDVAKRLALGPTGLVFVTGNSMRYNVYYEYDAQFATIALDPSNGQCIDSAYYDKDFRGNEDVSDVEVDTLGNVFVAGVSCAPYGNSNSCANTTMIVIKYGGAVVSGILDDPIGSVPSEFSLLQNYPNPFNASTVIPFELERDAHVEIAIFNVLGQRICSLVDADLPQGSHSVSWDGKNDNQNQMASGIYFYAFTSDAARHSRKMILLR